MAPKGIGKGDESKLKNNSFSEGIASVNEAIHSNETLNSDEEFDKFSQISNNNSYVYCDQYK